MIVSIPDLRTLTYFGEELQVFFFLYGWVNGHIWRRAANYIRTACKGVISERFLASGTSTCSKDLSTLSKKI